MKKRNHMTRLSVAALTTLLFGAVAHAHSGHHENDGILVQIFHWLWEPDHLLMLTLAALAILWALKEKRVSRFKK